MRVKKIQLPHIHIDFLPTLAYITFSKMNFIFKLLIWTAVLLLLFSCHGELPEVSKHGQIVEMIVQNDSGLFRGIELGVTKQELKAKERAKLAEGQDDYLLYEVTLDSNNYSIIIYSFDAIGLKEINVSIYVTDEDELDDTENNFKNYFTNKYGVSTTSKGFTTWKVQSTNTMNAALNMGQEIDPDGTKKLILTFYDAESM